MNKIIKPLIGALALGAAAITSTGYAAETRIVGGTNAAPGAFPWMVALVSADASDDFNGQFCGASLISSRWVLTAAHCVSDVRVGEVDAVIGKNNLSQATGGERIRVDRIIIHPGYPTSERPDVALLRLASPSSRTPVELVGASSNLATPGKVATVIGWGLTTENGSASRTLRQVSVPIISHAACNRAYPGEVNARLEICAGLTSGGRDSCQGDSGGPLFVPGGQGNQYRQAGVVSWGDGCARAGAPGVYARVSSLIDWIGANTAGEVGGGTSGGGGSSGGVTPPPAGTLTADFAVNCHGLRCVFNAARSTAGDNPIEEYVWNFGDGTWDFGRRVVRTYDRFRRYQVSLHVIDSIGDREIESKVITLKNSTPTTTGAMVTDRWTAAVARGGKRYTPNGAGKWMNAGPLVAVLVHARGRNFDLDLQKRNEISNRWESIDYQATNGIREIIRIPRLEAGYYRFSVMARQGQGRFRLISRHR